jgi:hypothetical protein
LKPVKPRRYGTTEQIIAAAFDQVGDRDDVLAVLGVKQSSYYAYTETSDAEKKQRLGFDQARQICKAGGTIFAEQLALDAGGYYTEVGPCDGSLAELMAREEEAHGRFIADLMRWLDGRDPSKPEPRVAEDLDRTIAALLAARRKVRA